MTLCGLQPKHTSFLLHKRYWLQRGAGRLMAWWGFWSPANSAVIMVVTNAQRHIRLCFTQITPFIFLWDGMIGISESQVPSLHVRRANTLSVSIYWHNFWLMINRWKYTNGVSKDADQRFPVLGALYWTGLETIQIYRSFSTFAPPEGTCIRPCLS